MITKILPTSHLNLLDMVTRALWEKLHKGDGCKSAITKLKIIREFAFFQTMIAYVASNIGYLVSISIFFLDSESIIIANLTNRSVPIFPIEIRWDIDIKKYIAMNL